MQSPVHPRLDSPSIRRPPSWTQGPITRSSIRNNLRVHSSRSDNRGNLRLYIDSASVYQWEKFSKREVFFGKIPREGITSNPLILQKDEVPQCNLKVYKILAKQAFDLGYQEIQLQVWGRDAATMYSIGQDIAGIDDRVIVKVPVTADGIAVAARLKREKAQVTATAVYSSRQALAAVAMGADFIAPYLGRMNRAGRNGFKEILEMNDLVKGVDSSTRILVASIASASDVTALTAQGCDTFTLTPKAADELFEDQLTEEVISEFEDAARRLGAYS